jgi:hypothetical protein
LCFSASFFHPTTKTISPHFTLLYRRNNKCSRRSGISSFEFQVNSFLSLILSHIFYFVCFSYFLSANLFSLVYFFVKWKESEKLFIFIIIIIIRYCCWMHRRCSKKHKKFGARFGQWTVLDMTWNLWWS